MLSHTHFPAAYTSAVSKRFTPLSYAIVISCSATWKTHRHTHIKIEIEGSTHIYIYIYLSHHSKCIVILLPFIFTQNFSDFIIREASVVQYQIKSNQIKSNQIKSLLLSHHHSTSALVSEILMSMLQTVQKKQQTIYIWTDSAKKLHWSIYSAPDSAKKKNNNLHMDSTYLQTVQKTMCKIHIHILSTHSVL